MRYQGLELGKDSVSWESSDQSARPFAADFKPNERDVQHLVELTRFLCGGTVDVDLIDWNT